MALCLWAGPPLLLFLLFSEEREDKERMNLSKKPLNELLKTAQPRY